ncbi:MAG: glycosyltransferase family 2 protein [Thermoleophilaceae bacterium]
MGQAPGGPGEAHPALVGGLLVTRPLRAVAGVAAAGVAGLSAYLLGLLAAASAARRRPAPGAGPGELPFTVLIPAHDEEGVIGATLDALARIDYPVERYEALVVADNCSDGTADEARARGASVLERRLPDDRGKGRALAWALGRLSRSELRERAVLILDADCEPSPNLLRALEARLTRGADAAQADYVVSNPEESSAAGLRYAGFALVNSVRPLGKSALGLSCGLLGTGMAFGPGLFERVPWGSFSLAEDAEYHAELVSAGHRVEFCPEASVHSPMPTSLEAGETQQSRWEAGRLALARRWTPRLVREGIALRDPVRLHAGLEQLVPPLSLAGPATLLAALLGLAARSRAALTAAAGAALCQAAFVIGGLLLVRAPAAAYRSLLLAPRLALGKLRLYADLIAGRVPSSWVRTERERTTPAQRNSRAVGSA